MFPSFKNKADKQRKLEALKKQAELDVSIRNAKQRAYKQAIWPGQEGKISLTGVTQAVPSVSVGVQTSAPAMDSSSAPAMDIGTEDDSLSDIADSPLAQPDGDEVDVDELIGIRQRQRSTGVAPVRELGVQASGRSEGEQMREEDLLSDLMRKTEQIQLLRRRVNSMQEAFVQADAEFSQLRRENMLSQMEIKKLHEEFEMGRRLYLELQAKKDSLEERVQQGEKLGASYEELKRDYANGEELYNALSTAYKVLQGELNMTKQQMQATIDKLMEENAISTARILEQQLTMKKASVSKSAAKQARSLMNTPQALRKFMQEVDVTEAWAATSQGKVSKTTVFRIKNGSLHKVKANEPEVNLEMRGNESKWQGFDFINTMVAIKHGLPEGTDIYANPLFKMEADAIRESGKPLTHGEAAQLDASMSVKRERNESFYRDTTPIKTETKKFKEDATDPPKSGQGLRGRGLIGRGVNGTRNLREAVGASAFEYKPLGSKFIRLPDLHNGILNIKTNNRTSAMAGREISDDMVKLIKQLVYKGVFDNDTYERMTLDDQKLTDKILKLTHLKYNLEESPRSPESKLMAEYDKLLGQLKLGNDNPSVIRELKAIAFDLHRERLISDDEARQILTY